MTRNQATANLSQTGLSTNGLSGFGKIGIGPGGQVMTGTDRSSNPRNRQGNGHGTASAVSNIPAVIEEFGDADLRAF